VSVRGGVSLVAAILTIASLPAVGADAAAVGTARSTATGCPTASVTFTESSAKSIAAGVTAIAGQADSNAGPVDVHLVRVDLSHDSVRVLGRGASGSMAVGDALALAPNAVAGVNGDLFHVTRDGSSVTPDGPEADRGALIKAGAGTPDALTLANGVAAVGAPPFYGTVTIVDGVGSAASGPPTAVPVRPTSSRHGKARHRAHTRARHKSNHRRHRKHHRRRPRPGPRPVPGAPRWPAGSVVIVPAPNGTPSAVATLNGVNDLDGGKGAVLITPAWGEASLPDQLPADTVEVMLDGSAVTGINTGAPVVPDAGNVALLLSGQNRQKIPWLAVGDHVSVQTALNTATGPAQAAIGGNARLVGAGVVDPTCSLVNDDTRRPRVAAGTYASGHMLMLVVSDGDTSDEPGLNLGELAALMHKLGAVDALNLDGGQSSTLDEKISGQWHEVNNGPGERWVTNVLAVVPS
jgi:hypothetical protein